MRIRLHPHSWFRDGFYPEGAVISVPEEIAVEAVASGIASFIDRPGARQQEQMVVEKQESSDTAEKDYIGAFI